MILKSRAKRPVSPHQFDVALGLTLKSAAGLSPIEVAVDIDLQQRLLLGAGNVDLVLSEQRLGVIAQHPH